MNSRIARSKSNYQAGQNCLTRPSLSEKGDREKKGRGGKGRRKKRDRRGERDTKTLETETIKIRISLS